MAHDLGIIGVTILKNMHKDIKTNLQEVDKLLIDTGETFLKTLDDFLQNVVKGTKKIFECPFKADNEKKKT